MKKTNLILIGFMGVGKDTIGKLVSKKLGFRFVSTDTVIEKQESAPLTELFNSKGDEYVHELENQILKDLLKDKKRNMVISTGGEIVLSEENRNAIKKLGIVVFLSTNSKEIIERMIRTPYTRPQFQNLSEKEIEDEVIKLMKLRENLYLSIQDAIIDTVGKSPMQTVEEVIDTLHSF